MRKKIKIFCAIILSSGIMALLCLFYILYKVNADLPRALNIEQSGYGLGIGYLFVLLFHFAAFLFILFCFKSLQTAKLLRVLAGILGVISLFAFGVEKVFYDEIARQSRHGMAIEGEVTGLNIALAVHILFAAAILILSFKTIKADGASEVQTEAKDEKVFTTAQYMGIVSGLMGILLTLSLIRRQVPADKLWIYIPFYLLILMPYALTVLYWLSIKLREKIAGWYDEKQFMDIMRSALTTLLLSVPGLALLLLIKKPVTFYYFPYYVFLVLFIFSAGTLYFFKKR